MNSRYGPTPRTIAASPDRRSPHGGSNPSPRSRTGPSPRIRTTDDHSGDRSGVGVDRSRLQHAEDAALRVGQNRPRHIALANISGCCPQRSQSRDQFRLVGQGSGGERKVRAVFHRIEVRDGDYIDADSGRVWQHAARGFYVRHAGTLTGQDPAERLRPEPAEHRVIPSLEIHLNQSQRHGAQRLCVRYTRHQMLPVSCLDARVTPHAMIFDLGHGRDDQPVTTGRSVPAPSTPARHSLSGSSRKRVPRPWCAWYTSF